MPTYPYVSGQAPVIQTFQQLRKGFPAKIDAGYLQRFDIARANESYVISILRFLGLIDDEGNRVEANTQYFYGDDETFQKGLDNNLRKSYSQVFDEMGEAFAADRSALVHWFRAADKTSDVVGNRQAATFQNLSALAGHGILPSVRASAPKKGTATSGERGKRAAAPAQAAGKRAAATSGALSDHRDGAALGLDRAPAANDVGLTVRIEVNLPPGGDAATYDAIFASIKKHLMS